MGWDWLNNKWIQQNEYLGLRSDIFMVNLENSIFRKDDFRRKAGNILEIAEKMAKEGEVRGGDKVIFTHTEFIKTLGCYVNKREKVYTLYSLYSSR